MDEAGYFAATLMSSANTPPTASGRRSSALRGFRVSLNGLVVIVVAVLVAVASFTSEANLLLLLFGIALGLVLFNAVACVRMLRKIDVERTMAGGAVAGRPFHIGYTVRSRRRWLGSWAIRIGEAPVGRQAPRFGDTFVAVLGPGEERRVEQTAICACRGHTRLRGIRLSCGFPFGLFTCRVDIEAPAELIVYPAVGRVRREFWHHHAMVETPGGRRPEHWAGQDEFHGVREYRHGDNPRWIHWRRSARTGELVVREHVPMRDSQLIVVVDPWPVASPARQEGRGILKRVFGGSPEPGCDPAVERIISAAATAVCEALDRGQRVGLICRAAVPIIVAPAGGRAHRQRLLNQLALLTPDAEVSLDQLIGPVRWSGWNARWLLFTPRTQDCHAPVLRLLAGRSESAMLVSPQSGWLDKMFDLGSSDGEERGVDS